MITCIHCRKLHASHAHECLQVMTLDELYEHAKNGVEDMLKASLPEGMSAADMDAHFCPDLSPGPDGPGHPNCKMAMVPMGDDGPGSVGSPRTGETDD